MKGDRLPTQDITRREREEKQRAVEQKRQRLISEKQAKQRQAAELKKAASLGSMYSSTGEQWEMNEDTQFASSQMGAFEPKEPTVNLEEIMAGSERFNPREAGEVVEKYGTGEEALKHLPMAEPPKSLATAMLPHQKQVYPFPLLIVACLIMTRDSHGFCTKKTHTYRLVDLELRFSFGSKTRPTFSLI